MIERNVLPGDFSRLRTTGAGGKYFIKGSHAKTHRFVFVIESDKEREGFTSLARGGRQDLL
jgi:hypothetical protein